jgi:hypothetical protein
MTLPGNPTPPPPKLSFADRLVAEAVRVYERDAPVPLEEPAAEAAAAASGGDLEQRIVVRAGALSIARPLREALDQVRRATGLVLVVLVLGAGVAGTGAARAALTEETVNVFWVLGGLLGVQTLLLLAWLVLMVRGPAALAAASLGGLAVGLGRRLSGRLHRGGAHAAAIEAAGVVFGRGVLARCTLGAISHGLWVVFNLTCILLVVTMLGARHYRFVWETTILSSRTYERLTAALAWLPRQAGFPVPDHGQIIASDRVVSAHDDEATRHAWSGFLVGSLSAYGLAPRAALAAMCLAGARRARRRYRLDVDRPDLLRVAARLMPPSARLGVVDSEGPEVALYEPAGGTAARPRHAGGAAAIMGLEIEPPASQWPPALDGGPLEDLGFVDGRADRRRVLDALAAAPGEPRAVVVVCSLTTTPDRGHRAFLGELRRSVRSPFALVLTGGQALRRRGDGPRIAGRVDDWRRIAADAGVEPARVVEVDLDHLTHASRVGLARLAGIDQALDAAPAARRIESAFALIVAHVGRWSKAPDTAAQASLHRQIGALYRAEHASWRSWFAAPESLESLLKDPAAALRAGAARAAGVLPGRLRLRPRWLAAGAAAGALGCVAAATLLSPAAIGALPVWTAVGAALGQAVRAAMGPSGGAAGSDAGAGPTASGTGDAVRAAALFALVLELQGRSEARITELLEATLPDDQGGEPIESAAGAASWLDGIRHRLDLALVAEAGP